ncbi:MAG: RnfABCDGE type electron transport complex subunit D [Candidatus Omnitrophica bacterium]|nr:RnfABCDGE type electron transport complex subunit D [Candidatus Omnitrophota bacterium]MBU4477922.1 RnfABCDGE type electron transport complex subunit D [Candidatus Omnitrophota bacterium]MCG2703850.1 RnfABCDGE type electron transport complex subunit D [Candidatus Omnitrophota bacterium]
MSEERAMTLSMTSSPHIRFPETTSRIMWTVFFCLIPSGIVSVYVFGLSTLWIIITAVLGAVATEYGCGLMAGGKNTISDGSAALTGLLLAYNLPPQAPLWMVFIGAFIAIVFSKVLFGGLGFNIFNPALIGRVFLMASFPVLMTRWPAPFRVDAVTAATPLAVFKDSFQGTNVLSQADIINYSYRDLFLGFRGGCIGEGCVAALLLGAVYLLIRGYISWQIPVSFIGTVAVFSWLFSGKDGIAGGDFILHILSGGLVLGAFYMATDYVTSPITKTGQLIFGFGCGLITGVIRLWGGYPEGVSYSILLMNILVPLLDKFIVPRRFGELK